MSKTLKQFNELRCPLEPCPACMNIDVYLKVKLVKCDIIAWQKPVIYSPIEREYSVVCDKCNSYSTESDDPEETIRWWNDYAKERREARQ